MLFLGDAFSVAIDVFQGHPVASGRPRSGP
jgi:hypothetical protein